MIVFVVLINLLAFERLVSGVPARSKDVHGFPDYDPFKTLESLGDKIYGKPKRSSGDALARWKPTSEVNPEEVGEYFEGDILEMGSFARNGIRSKSRRWPNRTVPFEISPAFKKADVQVIQKAIAEFHNQTCIKFKKRTSSDANHVYFSNDRTGCFSSVGRTGRGRQVINLQTPGCTSRIGTVIHEMLHAVGFFHEQSRPDRDDFVTVNFENIKAGTESNFRRASAETVDNQQIGYDYSSVMHYSAKAFSKNGKPTIQSKKPNVQLGQRTGFTKKDVLKVQKLYGCQ